MAGALALAHGLSFGGTGRSQPISRLGFGSAAGAGGLPSSFFILPIKIFAGGLTMGVYSVRWLVHLSDHLEIPVAGNYQIRL
jgi:hypothetical protein